MKVVITGGGGFLGLNLARRLVARGRLTAPSGSGEDIDALVLFDQTAPDERPAGLDDRVAFVAGDVADRATVDGLIDRDDISVFHLASVVSAGGEKDFDLALRVNLDGGLNVLEACRARQTKPRVVFTSSVATFGGDAPDTVSDTTKQVPETTYGMTKAMGELMINDYTRKGFIDGRTARLPTVIVRPGRPNAAASGFVSGVFREPLAGKACVLPVSRETRVAVIGHRTCIDGLIALHEVDSNVVGRDRAVNFPSRTCLLAEMIETVKRIADTNGLELGPITVEPDRRTQEIVDTWPVRTSAVRALALGLPWDDSLDKVVQDYVDDFLVD